MWSIVKTCMPAPLPRWSGCDLDVVAAAVVAHPTSIRDCGHGCRQRRGLGAPSPTALALDLDILHVHFEDVAGLVAQPPLRRGSSGEVDDLVLDVPPACGRHPTADSTPTRAWR